MPGGVPIRLALVDEQCAVHTVYPPHANPSYTVKVYAADLGPWRVPSDAPLPLTYRFPLGPGEEVHVDVYAGAGATPLAAAVFLHGPHGLALSQASVPPPAQGADLADVVGWFDVGAALPDAPPGCIVTPGHGRAPAALSWAAAIVAARAHGHLLRDMARTASGAYRVVRCTRCGGAIMARSAEEAGGRIARAPCAAR